MPKLTVSDGIEIHYYLDDFTDPWRQQKETILLHHGCAQTARILTGFVPLLARKYRVIRIDERGMGKSALPPGGYHASSERFVEDVLNLVDHLEINKFHFLGESSGGMVGILFAVFHPDRLLSLLLCQTPYHISDDTVQRYSVGEKDVGTAIRKYGLNGWINCMPGYQPFGELGTDLPMVEWFHQERADNPTEAVAEKYNWTFSTNLLDLLPQVVAPTLLINTAGGSYQKPRDSDQIMQEQIPNAKLALIEGVAGQGVGIAAPDLCVPAILDFLANLNKG